MEKGTKKFQLGKIDLKKTHRSGKVAPWETVKASVSSCTKCNQIRHSSAACPMLKLHKRRKGINVDWYFDEQSIVGSKKGCKPEINYMDRTTNNWIEFKQITVNHNMNPL